MTLRYARYILRSMSDTENDIPQEIHRHDHLTATEVAQVFGVHTTTVMRWEDRGLAPVFKTTGLWLYIPAEVSAFGDALVEFAQSKIPNKEKAA